MRQRPVTLIEVLIGLGLISILLTFLLGYYREVTVLGKRLETLKEESFQERYLQRRLSEVLTSAKPPKEKERFFFTKDEDNAYSRGKSLIFTYDNKAVLNTRFVNEVLGRIYLDREGRIILLTWPKAEKEQGYFEIPPMKKEILMEGVSNMDFSFYYYLDPEDPPAENKEKPTSEFQSDWNEAYQILPVWVELIYWKEADKPIRLVYPLPETARHVKYRT